ncbi:MAG TPA: hypothetical protein VFB35_02860 [Gaiellaceae bacterium]|nr:hypothetical protein [Gaiellaceae bacterium]
MAVAYVQEFEIVDGDTSTTNYDAIAKQLDLSSTPEGLIVHTAGFDHEKGVFRILDIWESREAGQRFIEERLNPVLEPYMAEAAQRGEDLRPPTADYWYDLHDTMS